MAGKAPAVPCSFHADQLVLAEPGRAPVRAIDRETPARRRPQVGQAARKGYPGLGGHMERRPQTLHLDKVCGRNPRITRATFAADQRSRTLVTCGTPLRLACTSAPPSCSACTSSPVTDLTAAGPLMQICAVGTMITTSARAGPQAAPAARSLGAATAVAGCRHRTGRLPVRRGTASDGQQRQGDLGLGRLSYHRATRSGARR